MYLCLMGKLEGAWRWRSVSVVSSWGLYCSFGSEVRHTIVLKNWAFYLLSVRCCLLHGRYNRGNRMQTSPTYKQERVKVVSPKVQRDRHNRRRWSVGISVRRNQPLRPCLSDCHAWAIAIHRRGREESSTSHSKTWTIDGDKGGIAALTYYDFPSGSARRSRLSLSLPTIGIIDREEVTGVGGATLHSFVPTIKQVDGKTLGRMRRMCWRATRGTRRSSRWRYIYRQQKAGVTQCWNRGNGCRQRTRRNEMEESDRSKKAWSDRKRRTSASNMTEGYARVRDRDTLEERGLLGRQCWEAQVSSSRSRHLAGGRGVLHKEALKRQ